MRIQSDLCQAIKKQCLVEIYYVGDEKHGNRIVEPHMIAYNRKDSLSLSAWFIDGVSASPEKGPGWREYHIASITSATLLNKTFSHPRPGYQPNGGKSFHNVQCAL